MKRMMLCAVALVAGCGGESLVKYDALRDKSSVWQDVSTLRVREREQMDADLRLYLHGDGKHPLNWSGDLTVFLSRPRKYPDFLGDHPKLVVPGSLGPQTIEVDRSSDSGQDSPYVSESASFGMSIEDLVRLAESKGKIELNGKPFQLTPAELNKIRQAIVAAREATNTGK